MLKTINDRLASLTVDGALKAAIAVLPMIGNYLVVTAVALGLMYFSLVRTSAPLDATQSAAVERAIAVLTEKGFSKEVFVLNNVASFRGSDNWLNGLAESENAFAATNFPFGVVTLYPDFFDRASDDTERAMILLHESRHVIGGSERDAFSFVWMNRQRLGWTTLSHGMTPAFVTIQEMTREYVPELFTCQANLWNDCTEQLRAKR